MAFINLSCFIECTEAEGPGKRFALWTQGCMLRCPECCNKEMQPIRPEMIVSTDEIMARIRQAHERYEIEGITLLGGEPFLQAPGLAQLARQTRELGMSVMCFTGYEYSWLKEKCDFDGVAQLLDQIDVLVDGPYVNSRPETVRNWAGSTNQRFIYLTDFYSQEIETRQGVATCEWRIGLDGSITINGFPADISIETRPE